MTVNIQLEWTPNPSTLKYVVDTALLPRGAMNFTDRALAAEKSPLVSKLFGIKGIQAVMLGTNFVTVTKGDDGEWDELNDGVMTMLDQHLTAGEEVVRPEFLENKTVTPAGSSEIEKQILEILENEIRPAVAQDGGDITLDRFEDGIVYLHMKGSCSGCPSSTATLKAGIETRLREAIPEVAEVVALLIVSKARRQVEPKHVRRELLPNQSPDLLKSLHLLTREGKLNADTLRKLKQVNHLVGLIAPGLDDVFERYPNPIVVDAGSGNAYLGFVLYELFFKGRESGEMICVESKAELHERAKARAAELGFSRMRFIHSPVEGAALPDRVHLVTALHACDTATDDALAMAISRQADHVAVVPCCQAEVAQQLKESKAKVSPSLGALFDHPWHRREFGSHLTNVIRALTLEAKAYSVTVTELTGWEHSLKNELILARRVERDVRDARAKLAALLEQTGVKPKLTRALEKAAP